VSNLISTLALTYTLLGISLGIGELSSSKLDIDTINQTISKLTQQFSMAFMTSVIGLPLSGLLRSILIIIYEHFTVQSLKISPKLLSK
jgi:ribose/xylose/arabinose/galactoside ABC-type transport system permease subunit